MGTQGHSRPVGGHKGTHSHHGRHTAEDKADLERGGWEVKSPEGSVPRLGGMVLMVPAKEG